MTFEEISEVFDAVFDEYLPKTSQKARTSFIGAVVAELQDREAIEVEDSIPDDEDEGIEDDV